MNILTFSTSPRPLLGFMTLAVMHCPSSYSMKALLSNFLFACTKIRFALLRILLEKKWCTVIDLHEYSLLTYSRVSVSPFHLVSDYY